MKTFVPKILATPAFRADGVLVNTADESDGSNTTPSRAAARGPAPNSPLPGITSLGGGRIGALVLSRYVKPNTWSTPSYNHYPLLAAVEDVSRLPYLGHAQTPGLNRFGLWTSTTAAGTTTDLSRWGGRAALAGCARRLRCLRPVRLG